MVSAIQILRHEHELILKALDLLQEASARLTTGETLGEEQLLGFVRFFREFCDRAHHEKEEKILFPILETRGISRIGGPIGCMLKDHNAGRAQVALLSANAAACAKGDPAARHAWLAASDAFQALLRSHISKENEVLFVLADRVLSERDQVDLKVAFELANDDSGSGELVALLDRLSAAAKV